MAKRCNEHETGCRWCKSDMFPLFTGSTIFRTYFYVKTI
uniref:Uncharacterized protein n=1 Tax=Anguilla anguilla TaxID=7936 RepID=A0A0E9W3M3_ANGAN